MNNAKILLLISFLTPSQISSFSLPPMIEKKIYQGLNFIETKATKTINKNIITYVFNPIKRHPYITALVVILLLHKNAREFISGLVEYMIDEHPIISIIMLGFLVRHICTTMEIMLIS